MGFVKEYNARTADQTGNIIPVDITIFEDRSFTFVTKTPPCIRSPAQGRRYRKGQLGRADGACRDGHPETRCREIAQLKMADLNTDNVEAAMQMVMGSARSMGIDISD